MLRIKICYKGIFPSVLSLLRLGFFVCLFWGFCFVFLCFGFREQIMNFVTQLILYTTFSIKRREGKSRNAETRRGWWEAGQVPMAGLAKGLSDTLRFLVMCDTAGATLMRLESSLVLNPSEFTLPASWGQSFTVCLLLILFLVLRPPSLSLFLCHHLLILPCPSP